MATEEHPPAAREATERFRHLPVRIEPEDMVAEVPSSVPMPGYPQIRLGLPTPAMTAALRLVLRK